MLLVLDVGNTNTVVGIYEGEVLRHSWRLVSERRTADELTLFLLNLMQMAGVAPSRVRGAIAAGVVPSLETPWQEGIRNALNIECLKVGLSLILAWRSATVLLLRWGRTDRECRRGCGEIRISSHYRRLRHGPHARCVWMKTGLILGGIAPGFL
jgi:type III pantothenate kinase